MAAGDGKGVTYHMNRLAGTLVNGVPLYDAQGAANIWAGTSGLGLQGALNAKAGITARTNYLALQGVLNMLAGTSGLGDAEAAARITGVPIGPAFNQIATYTAPGVVSSVAFNSIPQTYRHLHLRAVPRATLTSSGVGIQFNGDTGTNYTYHMLDNYPGNALRTIGGITQASIQVAWTYNVTFPGIAVVDILDYADPNKNTTVFSFEHAENNGGIESTTALSGVWNNTAPVTSILLSNASAINTGSVYTLYGVK